MNNDDFKALIGFVSLFLRVVIIVFLLSINNWLTGINKTIEEGATKLERIEKILENLKIKEI